MLYKCTEQNPAVAKIKMTYQIFDICDDLLLDTDEFEKAMQKAKSTFGSRIKVKGTFQIDFQFEHFEFGFVSPNAATSNETIENYIALRVEDDVQRLIEKSEKRRVSQALERDVFKL